MTIGFRSAASPSGDIASQATGTVTISKGSGTLSTDIMIAVFCVGGASTPGTFATPSGWTQVGTTTVANIRQYVFWSLGSNATLGFSFTAGGGGAQKVGWVCASFSGVSNSTPIDATGTVNFQIGAATLTTNAVTIATVNSWHLIGFCVWHVGISSATNFTVLQNGSPAVNQDCGLLYNTTPKSTGSTGTVVCSSTGTTSGQELTGIPFALRPSIDISVTESSTVTESVTVSISADSSSLTISVSDSSTVTASPTMLLGITISVTDSSTVTDPKPTMLLTSNISVSDSSNITESVTIRLTSNINVSDSSAVTDSPTVRLTSNINVSDSSAVTDTNTVRIDFNINSNDSSTVTDSPILMLDQNINVLDSSGVTDTNTVRIDFNINSNDSSTVTDSPNLNLSISINVSDDSGVDDSANVMVGFNVSVSEACVISEEVSMRISKKNHAGAFLIMWLAGNG